MAAGRRLRPHSRCRRRASAAWSSAACASGACDSTARACARSCRTARRQGTRCARRRRRHTRGGASADVATRGWRCGSVGVVARHLCRSVSPSRQPHPSASRMNVDIDAHLRAKARAQTGHANAFNASCEVMCRVRCSERENTLPHTPHSFLIAGVVPVAMCRRSSRKPDMFASTSAAQQTHPSSTGPALASSHVHGAGGDTTSSIGICMASSAVFSGSSSHPTPPPHRNPAARRPAPTTPQPHICIFPLPTFRTSPATIACTFVSRARLARGEPTQCCCDFKMVHLSISLARLLGHRLPHHTVHGTSSITAHTKLAAALLWRPHPFRPSLSGRRAASDSVYRPTSMAWRA